MALPTRKVSQKPQEDLQFHIHGHLQKGTGHIRLLLRAHTRTISERGIAHVVSPDRECSTTIRRRLKIKIATTREGGIAHVLPLQTQLSSRHRAPTTGGKHCTLPSYHCSTITRDFAHRALGGYYRRLSTLRKNDLPSSSVLPAPTCFSLAFLLPHSLSRVREGEAGRVGPNRSAPPSSRRVAIATRLAWFMTAIPIECVLFAGILLASISEFPGNLAPHSRPGCSRF